MMNNEKEKDAIDTSKLDEILPKYDPLKLNSINLAQNYVSAFNTGMNIYQCVNQLQGYIEWVVKAVNDVVKSWNVQVGESIDQSKAIVRETTTEQFNTEWTNKQPELIEQVNTLTTNQFNEDWGVLENRINTTLENQNTKINSIQTQQTNLANQQTNLANEQTTLSNRMDTFTSLSAGSTTGDAELQDIRVGANGVTYNNAGDAVRGQYSQLKEDLVDGNVATHITMPTNLYNKDAATIGGYISEGGMITENGQFSYSDFIEIDKTKKYAIWTVFGINYVGAFYDKNKQFIGLFFKTSISNGVIDFSSFSHQSYYNRIYFVRLNQTLGDMDRSMFIKDATSYPSDYIPYEKPKYEIVGNLSKSINDLLESYGLEKGYILINETLSNIAIGKSAMKNATTDYGKFNVAIGDNALMNNTGTGSDDTGNYNVAVGYKAMEKNTTGNHNTAVGFQSMPVNTTGTGNTAIGEDTCLGNTTGNGNTGVGRYSLFSNQEGGDNTAVGIHSLRENVGQRNTAIGANAGRSNKGNNNIFIGYYSNSSPDVSNSICIGQENYCFESNMMAIGSGYLEKIIIYTKTGRKLLSFNDDGTVTWSNYVPPTN